MLADWLEFNMRTRVVYGPGSVRHLGREAASLDRARALVVSDAGVEKAGIAEKVREGLARGKIEVAATFADVPPDSEVSVVRKGLAAWLGSGANLLVAVGGGSVIDTAKGINVLASSGTEEIRDFQGVGVIQGPLNPFVVVPTTAGTGSEVSQYVVIKDATAHEKVHLVSPLVAADLALLDPQLTTSLPKKLTAATAVDALTHAIESAASLLAQPLTRALATGAIREIVEWLPRAYEEPGHVEARGRLLLASLQAGVAMSNSSVGCIHGMAHATGAQFGVHHGVANGIFLPHGMIYNQEAAADAYRDVAAALAVEGAAKRPIGEVVAEAVERVRALERKVELPARLRDAGVPEDGLDRLAEGALADGAMLTNPREPDLETIRAVIGAAW